MVTKMADKIGLKQRNCHFGQNLRLFEDRFFKKLDISTAKYQKILLISSVKISFWYLLVLCVNFSVKRLKFAPKWSISYIQPILATIFRTIATVKVKVSRDFYTLVYVLAS